MALKPPSLSGSAPAMKRVMTQTQTPSLCWMCHQEGKPWQEKTDYPRWSYLPVWPDITFTCETCEVSWSALDLSAYRILRRWLREKCASYSAEFGVDMVDHRKISLPSPA